MKLDRFTQKAQESVLAAQQLAEAQHSPILDAEHLLAALVEPDDGVPAETLRRLGVDLPAFRAELAATSTSPPSTSCLGPPRSAARGRRSSTSTARDVRRSSTRSRACAVASG